MKKVRNPLGKRIKRELRSNLGKNLALFLFMTIMIAFVSGFLVADNSMRIAYDSGFSKYDLEDGHFTLNSSLSGEAIARLQEESDITVYPFYYKDKMSENGNTIRLYDLSDRKEHNRICLMDGKLPGNEGEIAIDRLYAENNGISIGDSIDVAGEKLTVTGMIAVPDYSCLFKKNTDMMFDANHFTVSVVTEDRFDSVSNGGINYNYIWYFNEKGLNEDQYHDRAEDIMENINDILEDESEDEIEAYRDMVELRLIGNPSVLFSVMGNGSDDIGDTDELLENDKVKAIISDIDEPDINYLTDFVQRYDNMAVTFTGDDMGSDKSMMTAMLYIVIVVLAFMYAIMTRSTVEAESKVIGTLRASGFTRGELVRHYMMIPVASTVLAAIAGNILGYSCFKYVVVKMYYDSYSLPTYETAWNGDAFLITTVIPLVIMILIVFIMLTLTLRLPPLQLLRSELKRSKKNKALKLKRGSFFSRFRKRILLQNVGSYVVTFFGIVMASLVLFFGMGLTPLLDHFKDEVLDSQIAEYQYVLKGTEETKYDGAEKYCLETLVTEDTGEEIMTFGVEDDSDYLKGLDSEKLKKDEIMISNGYAKKYRYEPGDVIALREKYEDETHLFRIKGVFKYDASLAVFMPRDQFNELFDDPKNYFTGYFSDRKLDDLDEEMVASVITSRDLTAVSTQLEDSFGSMKGWILAFCIVMYFILMYFITKTILDKNAKTIGLIKVLGYTGNEIGRLFNRATFISYVVSLVVALPVIYYLMRIIWDMLMTRFNGYLIYWVPFWLFPVMVGVGLVSYLMLHPVLMRRINKIPSGVTVKGME